MTWLALGTCAFAAPGDRDPVVAQASETAPIDVRWEFMSFAMASEKVVKGAPYSGESVYEYHQVLADGNRIDRQRSTLLFRDREGRTRQEVSQPHPMVFLNDPTTGRRLMLDPQNHTAVLLTGERGGPPSESPSQGFLGSVGSSIHRAFTRVVSLTGMGAATDSSAHSPENALPLLPPHAADAPPPPPGALVSDAPPGGFGPGGPGPGHPMGPGGPGGPPGPGGPGGLDVPSLPFLFREPRGSGVVTALGEREFDGVKAEGSRTTWTIAQGQVGNEKPLVLTSDEWYAPDLLLVVYSRDYDPRDGETIYQIKNLKRADPPAELFAVPSDYKIIVAAHGPGPRPPRPDH